MHSGCFCCRWFWKEQGLVSLADMNFQKCQKKKRPQHPPPYFLHAFKPIDHQSYINHHRSIAISALCLPSPGKSKRYVLTISHLNGFPPHPEDLASGQVTETSEGIRVTFQPQFHFGLVSHGSCNHQQCTHGSRNIGRCAEYVYIYIDIDI